MARANRRGTALILLAAFGGALAVTLTARGQTGPAEIRITDVQVRYRLARPAGGGPAGMVESIMARLYNPSLSKKPIGRGVTTCTFADSRTRSCVATFVLPKGTLVATGAIDSRLFYELPIVGGTGLYDNARGTLTVTATHLRPRHEVLLFRLVG